MNVCRERLTVFKYISLAVKAKICSTSNFYQLSLCSLHSIWNC